MEKLVSHPMEFHEISCFVIFSKTCRKKIRFYWNMLGITGILHEGLCTFTGWHKKTGTFEMPSGSHVQLAALRNRDLELQTTSPFSNHESVERSIACFRHKNVLVLLGFQKFPFFFVSLCMITYELVLRTKIHFFWQNCRGNLHARFMFSSFSVRLFLFENDAAYDKTR